MSNDTEFIQVHIRPDDEDADSAANVAYQNVFEQCSKKPVNDGVAKRSDGMSDVVDAATIPAFVPIVIGRRVPEIATWKQSAFCHTSPLHLPPVEAPFCLDVPSYPLPREDPRLIVGNVARPLIDSAALIDPLLEEMDSPLFKDIPRKDLEFMRGILKGLRDDEVSDSNNKLQQIRSVLQHFNGAVATTSPVASALLGVNVCAYELGCVSASKQVQDSKMKVHMRMYI